MSELTKAEIKPVSSGFHYINNSNTKPVIFGISDTIPLEISSRILNSFMEFNNIFNDLQQNHPPKQSQ
ncbi:MAG: hypothetical protein LBU72_00345 [Burkholderiaceae bacterium]|jgi:hypothetical protein|nr:hypothetical protein [Burkholderiaceae bacterium]